LAYTDGLVERRDMWIDEGMDHLRDAAAGVDRDLDAFCDGVLSRMLTAWPTSEDVALIALKLTSLSAADMSLELPAEADQLTLVRRALRQWLAGRGASQDESYEILVATTEAAANAVEHAYGPLPARIHIEASSAEGVVEVRVRDSGTWRPPRGANRGRGTLLMQELMDGFEVVTGDAGTEVRLRRRLGGGESS
jgi:anti-sigma regulatory factor (Ser/Thr protein kinase)